MSNATTGLTLALQGLDVEQGRYCAVPSFTFPATPAAAIAAGLRPYFVDIEPSTLELSVEAVTDLITRKGVEFGAVMPVAPFGDRIGVRQWEAFRDQTGIPVVMDTAWGFGNITPSPLPQVISFHATKSFGIGEGGMVLSTDESVVGAIRCRSNFGFEPDRSVRMPGVSGKPSEYAAAVGLAGLDEWPERRVRLHRTHALYRAALSQVPDAALFPRSAGQPEFATVALLLSAPVAVRTSQAMQGAGVDARPWYPMCHTLPAFEHYPRGDLETTDWVDKRILNLPFWEGMDEHEIDRVVSALQQAQS